jgi:hypothetical protein
MKVTMQHTGYAPVEFDALAVFTVEKQLGGDKRGVRITAVQVGMIGWRVEVAYLSTWGIEQNYFRCSGINPLSNCAEWVRNLAPNLLPPGAGFPATPQYETRQRKLAGMLETATLVALSDVLAQVSKGEQL